MTKRSQPSSIDILPEDTKALIGKLRLQGRTIDEINDHLKSMDVEVSRSALGRHVKKLAVLGERMRRSRDMAASLVDRFGDQPDNKVARMNLEMMHTLILDVMTAETTDEEGEPMPVTLDPEQVNYLASALRSLTSAQKTDEDRMFKIKAELAKEAAKAVDTVSRSQGLTPESARMFREAVLGVVKP
ncbi:DUF3486 family protein [Asticcacaulis sp. YBE204]|uniref:DUF3486 family protein n=1 Tax=Asticcacaulis sp. YBE204 TaxID=1282363 RepID=UPI0003C3FAEC|nr:DUF3486 family protein [Asticcacaulis sp. YBE204]ESQ78499.1 hypothetical protein AEYBE204_13175 [Asticcacaulis sp. YBE204]